MGTGAGQTMTFEGLSSNSIVIGPEGDGNDHVCDRQEGTTRAGTSRVDLSNLLTIAAPEPDRRRVTIR